MWTKIIGIFGGLLLLAACSSAPETAPGGPPGGPGGPGMGGPGGIGSRNALPGSQQDLEASAGDRVFFAFDRSDITPESQQILERQADWLRRYPNVTVTIEGHCDERGTREYNLALGRCRVERRGLCADPARRHHGELKKRPPAVGARPFFALKGL
jgi:peptidoglycan-associated lipoprotein